MYMYMYPYIYLHVCMYVILYNVEVITLHSILPDIRMHTMHEGAQCSRTSVNISGKARMSVIYLIYVCNFLHFKNAYPQT